MDSRKSSAVSLNESISPTKTVTDNNETKPDDEDISPRAAIASLIKTQPVIHHPQTASDTSSKLPSRINASHVPSPVSSKPKNIESSQSKFFDSDSDDTKQRKSTHLSLDNKKKMNSTLLPKKYSYDIPRRPMDSKLKVSHPIPVKKTKPRERLLPKIRPPRKRKNIIKPPIKDMRSEFEKRVASAKNHQINKLQSSIHELYQQLEEERLENRTLRIIQKREETELKKYTAQEEDMLLILRTYANEIEDVKEKIHQEKEIKYKLEKEIHHHDRVYHEQTKRIKDYKKLIKQPNIDDIEELRAKLTEVNKKLKKQEEQVLNQEKQIESLEKTYRHEIHEEFAKRRELKHESEDYSKKYTDLLLKFEDKSRQVDTMHIYIQRGGRRPSHSSTNLIKSLSLQSLEDASPRFREKVLEYDKKRREQDKLKPKPKPLPLPNANSPPKRERKKYVPNFETKRPLKKSTSVVIPNQDEKPMIVEHEPSKTSFKPEIRRLSTPKSSEENRSDYEQETVSDFIHLKPPSAPSKSIQRREQHIALAPIPKRSLTPTSPPFESKFKSFGLNGSTARTNAYNNIEPIVQSKSQVKHELDDKWSDLFDNDRKEEPAKSNLISKLTMDQQNDSSSTTPTPPPSQQPALIMFEPTSKTTNGHQTKASTRITKSNIFDFDQVVNNLHDGMPVSTPVKTKRNVDTFESLFHNPTAKPMTNRMNGRDDTFTTTSDRSDHLDGTFDRSASPSVVSSTVKSTSKQFPMINDKLQRPKIITNTPKPIPNRTVVEEIEEFVL